MYTKVARSFWTDLLGPVLHCVVGLDVKLGNFTVQFLLLEIFHEAKTVICACEFGLVHGIIVFSVISTILTY